MISTSSPQGAANGTAGAPSCPAVCERSSPSAGTYPLTVPSTAPMPAISVHCSPAWIRFILGGAPTAASVARSLRESAAASPVATAAAPSTTTTANPPSARVFMSSLDW